MNKEEIKKILNELTADIDSIADKKAAAIINVLINLVEILAEENAQIKEINQQLRDEINRLKGEQGKPNIRRQSKGGDGDNASNTNHSSEAERKKRSKDTKNNRKNNKKNILIDRRVTIAFDKTQLPGDAKFKGFETRVVQDIKITTDNVEFKLETYYSASLNKTFIAPLPIEYRESKFGPGVKALIITLYRDAGMTELVIERFLKTFGLQISHGKISSILTEDNDVFHAEKDDIIDAGRQSSVYQHMDDTGSRVNGKNHYTHILCNDFFTAYFTRHKKDRLTLLDLLCRDQLKFMLNPQAYELMSGFDLATKWLAQIKPMLQTQPLTRTEMNGLLQKLFEDPKRKHNASRLIILESAALAYYQQSDYVIQYLMSDDAPQFNKIALHNILCWIHEGRHYKKLNPLSDIYRKVLDEFLEQFWDYYHALLTYKEKPSQVVSQQLSTKFEMLFTIITGYDALDQRIAMTYAKKERLLLVLDFPFLPLHNNPAELGARVQARIRDINFQTVSENGTKSKDTFATIVQTARKLGVNIYQYIYDRVTQKFEMLSLANMILLKAQNLQNTA